jgi:hypothetical protein
VDNCRNGLAILLKWNPHIGMYLTSTRFIRDTTSVSSQLQNLPPPRGRPLSCVVTAEPVGRKSGGQPCGHAFKIRSALIANLKLLITNNTLPNMFDLCPPFQIDGNLGGPAAIAEMLVQSTESEIRVLPALPLQWPSGSLNGVRVRGGGKLDFEWKDGHLTRLALRCDHPMKYRVLYGASSSEVEIPSGRPIVLDGMLHRISQ